MLNKKPSKQQRKPFALGKLPKRSDENWQENLGQKLADGFNKALKEGKLPKVL